MRASSLVRWTVGTPVEVGRHLAAAGVEEHHADAVGAVHGLGLVDPADAAALAHHDPSRHPGRVEAAGQAEARLRRRRPAAATRAPSTTRAGRVSSRAAIAPVSRSPGATTAPRRVTPVVPPTEVTHGEAWAAYPRVPRLPDAPTTTMSASAAPSSARSTVVDAGTAAGFAGPSTERFSTSTRSAHRPVDGRDEVGRRAAVVARVGGGPAGLVDGQPRLRRRAGVDPARWPGMRTSTPALPAATEAISVP